MSPKSAQEEIIKNCAGCNKPLKRVSRYYRNGRFFCSKGCFATFWTKHLEEKKQQEEEARKKAEEAKQQEEPKDQSPQPQAE